ncbi:prolyl oligopeptidase family serine peptidase [Confluentibacter lentus]|uniref:prolyl oligopeptidase family serine peptidase n=1 Tax=Confluentibacter lentus TaxID=1699412 RepID=UPI000C295960|nr:prolyl oligopeptidase family serine peptidase [Confluentibacter lentus]
MKYVCLVLLGIIILKCDRKENIKAFLNYPHMVKYAVKDNYYSVTIEDEYRHLENLHDSTVINWFRDQDDHAEKFLGELENQVLIAGQIRSYYSNEHQLISNVKSTKNGRSFFLKGSNKGDVEKLFYKENIDSDDIELFDPRTFQKDLNREYTINYIQPSWEGGYVLVSLGYDGLKGSSLVIIDMRTKKLLPEIITNAAPDTYLGVSWLPDSSGFLYLYIPVLDSNEGNYMLNSSTVMHKLGDDPDKRHIVFSSRSDKGITKEDIPIAKVLSNNDEYIIGYKASVENYWSAYYANISDLNKDEIIWKPFYSTEDKIYADYGYFMGDEFVFVSGKDADNRCVSSFNIKSKATSTTKQLVPEKKDEVITSLYAANNKLYYTTSKFGVEAFLYEYKEGEESKLKLPYTSGAIHLYSSSNESPNLYIGIDGWTIDYKRFIFKDSQFKLDPLSSHQNYPEFDELEVKEIQVLSHDGVQVPMSLIYRKDIKMNGLNPTFIYTYGAYGETIAPYFSPIFLNWVQNGGVFAVPHIRGGGEKGDSWHKQGMKSTKSNSWRDIIACTEYLIENKFTSKGKTVLYSSSAGTVSTGMAIVERPDLFKVFVAVVPMLNPLRSEARTNNASNYLEYGSVKDSLECMALIKMDPYVNLKPNVDYPASLIISSFYDARIDPWIPGKFAAKLQAYSTSGLPVFLDVIYDAGHDGGDTMEERIQEYSRVFAFAFWQTNHSLK